ncbi:hypothetical protein ABPG74_016299 [Tetrahymena malaccensis]
MDNTQVETLYQRLSECIKERNHDQVVKVCDQILQKKQDDKVIRCRMIALLKSEKYTTLQAEYEKSGAGQGDEQQQLAYAYYLYCSEKYDDCLKFLNQANNQSMQFQVLQAQTLNKLSKFSLSAELYAQILKKYPKTDDYSDLLVNAIASSIQTNDQQIQKNIQNLVEEYLKNQKQPNNELIYNYGTLLGCLHETERSRDMQLKFKQMIQEDNDKQDEIMAVLQADYADFINNKYLVGEELEKKIKQYEEFQKQNLTDKNLKAVLNNNVVVFRYLHKHEQYGDSLKLIDEAIQSKFKQTQEQIFVFKLNKSLLLIQKGKFQEALTLLNEIEHNFSNLDKNIKFLSVKTYILMKSKKDDLLNNFLNQLNTNILINPQAPYDLRIETFLLLSEVARSQGSSQQILQNFQSLHNSTSDKALLYENEIICCFILSYITKIKSDENSSLIQPILNQIATNTHNPQVLQYLGDVYSKTDANIALQIYTKLAQQFPKESSYQQRLAKLHSSKGEFEKAQSYLKNIKFNIIEDYTELTRLESEIALSKIQTKSATTPASHIAKKITKPKKKRVRYPKGFDPKNPGPLPNPERWLPKWERKDFKKKKGAALNSRTQGSSAAAQDTSTSKTFAVSNSTAHIKAKEKSKNKKNKKK